MQDALLTATTVPVSREKVRRCSLLVLLRPPATQILPSEDAMAWPHSSGGASFLLLIDTCSGRHMLVAVGDDLHF